MATSVWVAITVANMQSESKKDETKVSALTDLRAAIFDLKDCLIQNRDTDKVCSTTPIEKLFYSQGAAYSLRNDDATNELVQEYYDVLVNQATNVLKQAFEENICVLSDDRVLSIAKCADAASVVMNEDSINMRKALSLVGYQGTDFLLLSKEDLLGQLPTISPLKKSFPLSGKYNLNRKHPITGDARPHLGNDFAVPKGTPLYATISGKVTWSQRKGAGGKVIEISNERGVSVRYLHLDGYEVEVNQKVKEGDLIGYSGSTGRVTGPHLHYEVRLLGKAVDSILLSNRYKKNINNVYEKYSNRMFIVGH